MTADEMLLTAIRHNCWANERIIEFCERLSPEQLAWTVPGTYGSIHRTLHHVVGAEHRYLLGLTGQLPPIETGGGGRAMTADWTAPLDELAERARSNLERMERYLASGDDPERRVTRPSGHVAAVKVIVAQLIHHGSDHRAQVGTILGAHGMTLPELNVDVWQYGRSVGAVTPPPGER